MLLRNICGTSKSLQFVRRLSIATAALTATFTLASCASAQSSRDHTDHAFDWSGTVPAGRAILIKDINGAIRVERSNNGRVEVTADKVWRRGNPADVRIEQPRIGGGDVLICALWSADATCDESGIHTQHNRGRDDYRNDNHNDVSVNFVLRVPDGVRVDLSTVNGGLVVNGVTTEIDAHTVNGDIDARSTGGPVRAKTVNGSINIAMGGQSSSNLEYETVNGSVTLELPSSFSAQLDLSTVNGHVSTEFPITVLGTLSPRKLHGTIGGGAVHLRASTVNGSVSLRRGN